MFFHRFRNSRKYSLSRHLSMQASVCLLQKKNKVFHTLAHTEEIANTQRDTVYVECLVYMYSTDEDVLAEWPPQSPDLHLIHSPFNQTLMQTPRGTQIGCFEPCLHVVEMPAMTTPATPCVQALHLTPTYGATHVRSNPVRR